MYSLFTLDSRACLVLPDCGVWLSLGCWFRSHRVVSQSCLVSLVHIHIWAMPISTGSTRKTPFASSGSHCTHEVRQRSRCGGLESMCWVVRQTCSALCSARWKSFAFQGCISEQVNTPDTTEPERVSLLPQPSGLLWGSWSCFIPSPLGCPSAL